MKETELKLHPCYCGGEMELKKVAQDGGMDGMYENWELSCKKCGLTRIYAADSFYGRKYKTFEEVIDDWNRNKKKEENIKADVFDKIRAEIRKKMQFNSFNEGYVLYDDIIEILDKYKAKGEEMDA